jgi:hypothetical protein
MKQQTKEDKILELRFEELMLRGKLHRATWTYRIPCQGRVQPFPINKTLTPEELFAEHSEKLSRPLVAAWEKLVQIRTALTKHGVAGK